MRLTVRLLPLILLATMGLATAAEDQAPPLTSESVEKLLTTLRTGKTPNIYSSIYYPKWKQALEGLRSVTVELAAEHANRVMKSAASDLQVHAAPITKGKTAAVILRRTKNGQIDRLVPAYLHLDPNGKDWGFLALPIPYERPVHPDFPPDEDDKFISDSLNVEHGFESKLYEFDKPTLENFQALKKQQLAKISATEVEEKQIGLMVKSIQAALLAPEQSASLDMIARYGTDSRYYTMIRGWLNQELSGAESQLDANRKPEAKAQFQQKVDFLKKAIRRIDLE